MAPRSPVSAMERVHRGGRSQVLVQYRDAAELLGNARSIQKGSGIDWWADQPRSPDYSYSIHAEWRLSSCRT
ncbi:hypothetical protein MKX07_006390 [Trichoderma sp. CBMAI-0711]|nr:hypothetical protein MKX07_006390 [Trichoderma sp. CBMAI-0711]